MQANRLFVLETVSAFASPTDTPPSLLTEGWGMLSALLMDLAQTGRFALTTILHPRLRSKLFELTETCPALSACSVDWTVADSAADPITIDEKQALLRSTLAASESALLIAPEMDGELVELARLAESIGVKLLSPGSNCCQLFSDKMQTADRIRQHVPSQLLPATWEWSTLEVLSAMVARVGWDDYPRFVIKPIDGAGSDGVYVGTLSQLASRLSEMCSSAKALHRPTQRRLLQPFITGLPASIALCRSRTGKVTILPPCQQLIDESDDGNLAYRGSQLLSDHNQIARSKQLANEFLKSSPPSDWVGYLGLDMVLADSADGLRDVIIEVNPRLTTSYLCYRAIRADDDRMPHGKPLINLVIGDAD